MIELTKKLIFKLMHFHHHSANFPVICITLRENLRTLFSESSCNFNEESSRKVFAFAAVLPPLIIAFFTQNVALLVGITGAYGGLAIEVRKQY